MKRVTIRVPATTANLGPGFDAFGCALSLYTDVTFEEMEDGLEITGGAPLHGAVMDCYGDHRIAMSFLMAGLNADGETTLHNCHSINTSYPGFEEHLRTLTQG